MDCWTDVCFYNSAIGMHIAATHRSLEEGLWQLDGVDTCGATCIHTEKLNTFFDNTTHVLT